MLNLRYVEPIDYLVVGHITQDLTPSGPQLGGTATYAALTARSLGLRVGIVTAWNPETPMTDLAGIQIIGYPSERSTTFQNINTPQGRVQNVFSVAPSLGINLVPETWRSTPIVHLGPVLQEVEPSLVRGFPSSFIGLTLQGWLREVDTNRRVRACEWPEARYVLENSSAAVLSIEDVQGDELRIEELASSIRILVVTEGAAGARVYWNGDLRRFRPPSMTEVDPIGAGDIFATAFFIRLHNTRDPWEAARFATQLAANSVTRTGLLGVPTPEEVQASMIEII
ncbi:MAG TPA: PfkB family carbohydrate kinase [Anaerolineaceae bacterium]|nr:PfkB family carbohydrate kinase [Anaerolineaceae bacterium]